MTRKELLLKGLHGLISWRKITNRSTTNNEVIYLSPLDLLSMLQMYLENKVDERCHKDWADWFLSQEVFVVEGAEEDDSVADYCEPMWYVLQQLSTPFIDGPITKEGVRRHVSTLSTL